MLNLKYAFGLAVCGALAGCAPGAGEPGSLAERRDAVITNGDFELGTAGNAPPAPWVVTPYRNPNGTAGNPDGITVQTPQTRAGLNLLAGQGNLITTEINGVSQPDPDLTATATLRWPRYGAQCARVNFHSNNAGGNGRNVNSLTQTMTIAPGDVDAADGKLHVRFVFAPVLQNPAHPGNEQPYYMIQVTNVTKGILLYSDFNLSAQAGIPWQTINGGTANEIDYVDWTLVDVSPPAAQLAQGDQVQLEFLAAGCSLGAHFGELYVDGVGTTIPGLNVTGTAPAQVNAGTTLTYSLRYRNGAAIPETGVTITFNTPPNTTFQSITPPAGAVCVGPAVGTAGPVTCTFAAPVAAGGTGTFSITVNVLPAATGQIVAGNYSILSTQETALLGSKIITKIGCALDADCAANQWCNETSSSCSAKLPNGTTLPTDAPHTAPTLNGTCTALAGSLVCTSAVCDTADNKCGFANGDGTCTVGNGPTVCRSAVCDGNDTKCGYANGDGPCTVGNGPTVCRSGSCSTNGFCQPPGGCNVDADCTGGKWCAEATHTCTAKLPNGTTIPTDAPHTAPTLNGTCTALAGSLVCTSAVCDTADNKCGFANGHGTCTVGNGPTVCRSAVCDGNDTKCGYANGDGPCTTGNAGTVCRSGACSTNGFCQPPGGCNVDTDCAAGNWCNETSHSCSAKLPNGTTVPTDVPHSSPTLDGTCSIDAGKLVCSSAVCDTADDKCGYADGDGPCTTVNGPTVCRSASCSTNGFCQPPGGCNVDADCTAGNWCNVSQHSCQPTLPNATPIPSDPGHTGPTLDGTCSAAAGTLVCSSGVCDASDDACGFVNGTGPCTAGNGASVCRSTLCATSGANQGTCVSCLQDSDCPSPQMCNLTSNTCGGCITSADCSGNTPVCVGLTTTCTACNGDNGSTASAPCPTGAAPFCFLAGSAAGTCGKCSVDADCQGHTGTLCETGSGLCTTGCRVDGDCTMGQWCNAEPNAIGACTPKLPNGTPLPQTPMTVKVCTPDVGQRVCVAGACDVKDNACGFATGDGSCQNDEQCRQGTCDPTNQTCTTGITPPPPQCSNDADCTSSQFCAASGNCTPKLPVGVACSAMSQCETGDCRDNVCSGVIGQGAGVCSVRAVGSEEHGALPLLFGLLLGAAGIARRRRAA